MIGFKKLAHRITNTLLALFIISAQLFVPIGAMVPKAVAAAPQINYNNFEGEIAPQNSNNWTNGNISGYKEGDTVRFRVDLDSDAGLLNGDLLIGFTSDPSCRFFKYQNPTDVALDFNRATNTIDAGSGFSASFVSLAQVGSDAVAKFSLNSTVASSVRLNFTLQLDDNAAACGTGSSQHVEANDATGDVKKSGNKALPIPSTAVAPVTDITVSKSGTTTASIGGGVSYTITVSNLDLTPAAGVIATDVVPNGITPSTATFDVDPLTTGGTGNCTISSQTVTCSLGTLGGNDSNTTAPEADKAVITVNGTVNNNTVLCGTTLINNVSVSTTTLESNSNNNNASASTQINPCLGTLTVIKNVINDNGGQLTASSFNVHVKSGGNDITGSPSAGSETGTTYNVGAGTYTISEDTPPTGYTQTSIVCNGQVTNTVTVTLNSTNSCTITNNDVAPSLTLNKIVSNTHGGTASESNWTLTASGPTPLSGAGAVGNSDVVSGTGFSAGTYTLSESTGPAGYAPSAWTCTGVTVNANNQITLANGQTTVCSITNSDIAPTLTVIKNVINDNGGTSLSSAFTMIITGTNVANASFAGLESPGTTTTLNAGSYSVGETGPAGYAATYSADCSGTIALGETKTCTVTNNDISPTLQLIKSVLNNNGGTAVATDWNLTATPSANTVGATTQSGAGGFEPTNVYADVQYTLTETGLSGYTPGTWDCTDGSLIGNILTLALDDDAVCTIFNDDNAPTLTLVKQVTNDNGGTAEASDWTLTAAGPTGFSGVGPSVSNGASFDAGTYNLSETGPSGYTASDWVCIGGTQDDSDTVTVGLGQSATCTITNNDNTPILHLRKVVTNDNGGTATLSDFTLTANGTGSNDISGTSPVDSAATLDADTFALSETGPTGYTASNWVCVGGTQDGANITLALGQEATCTITNNDNPPSLTLVKVVNSSNETREESDWTLTAAGPTGFSGVGPSVSNGASFDAGTYNLSETGPSGYTASDWVCIGGTQDDSDTVTVGLGQSATCTITNTELGSITIIKDAQPDSDEEFRFTGSLGDSENEEAPNFTLTDDVGDDDADRRTFDNLTPGTYTVTEPNVIGWTLESITCVGGNDAKENERNAVIKLEPGENVSCTFVNTRDTGTVKVNKLLDDDGNGTFETTNPTEFTWSLDEVGASAMGSTVDNVESGTHDIDENAVTGYHLVGWYFGGTTDEEFSCTNLPDNAASGSLPALIDVAKDQTTEITICNARDTATITVNKNVDMNADGDTDDEEDIVGATDWTWDLGTSDFTTGSTQEVVSGTYTIHEDQKVPDYEFVSVTCVNNQEQEVVVDQAESFNLTVNRDDNITCTFTNVRKPVALILEKTNNRPAPTVVGDVVTYTLTVRVPENSGTVYNAAVTDIPPEGFEFIPGTDTATTGSLTKTYASPGIWSLGDLLPGSVVTLTYQTRISNTASAGTYPDIAYAEGCDTPAIEDDCEIDVYSNVTNLNEDGTPFVGTRVAIRGPQVLGASTTVLVNTGAADIWRNLAVGTLLMGVALATLNRRDKKGGRA